nr:retrovirus-related Pol polyprotein from transposon TNT 1-94 [Tanacetum cinerariifolium]
NLEGVDLLKGQFCDSDLEVVFRRNASLVKNLEGVDLLKGDRSTNLYTINLYEMASVNDLFAGLPKFKYHKEHLCPSCEQGKSKRSSHPPKPVPNLWQRLHLLHMDLCGPMRIASINGKRYVLVIVDDYSRYTWVHFLRSKDDAPDNQVLKEYFESVGISHQMSSVRTPQQNGVVERRNRTLVEAARTMLIFSRTPLFLWAEAIAIACFTQNRSIIHCRFNKTPYELINRRKPDFSFLHVVGAPCYPKNDRDDIGKLDAKGDIGFFIGYYADFCAYRIYNRRTKKIIETMNVSFDKLSTMAFKQRSSKPGLKRKRTAGIWANVHGEVGRVLRHCSDKLQVYGRRSYFPPANTIPRHSGRKNTSIVESKIQTNATMADNRRMAQMLQEPIEGYEDAIVVPPINANNFELKQTLINLVQSNQFTGRQDPHNHLRFFNKVTSTFRHPEVPNTTVKLLLFPFSLKGEARIWLDKEPPRSILTWEDLVSKFINQFLPPSRTTYLRNEITNFLQKSNETFNEAWERFKDLLRQCPHHGLSKLHQLDTFYNALNPNDQDALDSAAGGNFLDKIPRECLSIIESKSKVRYSRSRVTDVRANANAPLTLSSSSHSNSFDLQQIAAAHEDKLDIRMNRFEKSLNEMKNSFVTPTAPLKAVTEFQTAAVGNFIQNRQIVSTHMRPPGFHQSTQQNNNQNRFQGNNLNQNRPTNQGAIYQNRPPQNPTFQAPPQQNTVTQGKFEAYTTTNDANMNNLQLKFDNFRRNQQDFQKKVHIHTFNEGLIKEDLFVRLQGKEYKVDVMEEIHDITILDILETRKDDREGKDVDEELVPELRIFYKLNFNVRLFDDNCFMIWLFFVASDLV